MISLINRKRWCEQFYDRINEIRIAAYTVVSLERYKSHVLIVISEEIGEKVGLDRIDKNFITPAIKFYI